MGMEREISDLQALVAPSELDMVCPHCGAKVYPRLSRAGPHIRADCPECDRYIKFARQRERWHGR